MIEWTDTLETAAARADAERGAELTDRWDEARAELAEQDQMLHEARESLRIRQEARDAAIVRETRAYAAWDAWQKGESA